MAGTGVAVASGDLIPLLDDNGSGVYNKGRNNSRDVRVGLLGSMFLSGSDGYTPRPGVLVRSATGNDLKVDQAISPNQTVIVRKGNSVIPRTGQGAYLFVNEADQIVSMPAASAVNPRYDIVCCSAYDKGNFVGDAAHGPQFWIEQGVVAGAPVVPATPAGMLKLAEVLRAVNDNTISTEIADKRTSTSLHQPHRILLPGDSTGDSGATVGETRYSALSGPEIWTGALWIPIGRPSYATIAAIPAALAVSGSLVYHTGLKRLIRHNGTTWDRSFDQPYQRAYATTDTTVGYNTNTDVIGATTTFSTAFANETYTVTAVFEVQVNSLNPGYVRCRVIVDGVVQSREVLYDTQTAITRGTMSLEIDCVLASAGSHTIKLAAWKDSNAGVAIITGGGSCGTFVKAIPAV